MGITSLPLRRGAYGGPMRVHLIVSPAGPVTQAGIVGEETIPLLTGHFLLCLCSNWIAAGLQEGLKRGFTRDVVPLLYRLRQKMGRRHCVLCLPWVVCCHGWLKQGALLCESLTGCLWVGMPPSLDLQVVSHSCSPLSPLMLLFSLTQLLFIFPFHWDSLFCASIVTFLFTEIVKFPSPLISSHHLHILQSLVNVCNFFGHWSCFVEGKLSLNWRFVSAESPGEGSGYNSGPVGERGERGQKDPVRAVVGVFLDYLKPDIFYYYD